MSNNMDRSASPQPSYMKPTIASDARSRRSTYPSSPTTSTPSSPRTVPAGPLAGCAQPSPPVQGHVKGALKSKPSSSCTGGAAREKKSGDKFAATRSSERRLAAAERKTSFGIERSAREDKMGAEMARIGQEKGLIDDETARNWSTQWHTQGELVQTWSEETRAKYNGENAIVPEEIMSLEEALRIKAKKDADQEEVVAAFQAGFIDENGIVVASGEEFEAGSYSRLTKSRERQRKEAPKKETLKKVTDGRVTKPTAAKKSLELKIIDETTSVAAKAVTKPTNAAPKKDDKKAAPKAVSTSTSDKFSPGRKEKSPGEVANDDDFCLLPRPGMPNYQDYKYYDLTALLRDRNVRSGGREERCRNRLIQDDIYIVNQQWDMRDARNWTHQSREVKTESPNVPNMPVAPPAKITAAMKKTRKAGQKAIDPDARSSTLPTANKTRKRSRDDEDDGDAGSDTTANKKAKIA